MATIRNNFGILFYSCEVKGVKLSPLQTTPEQHNTIVLNTSVGPLLNHSIVIMNSAHKCGLFFYFFKVTFITFSTMLSSYLRKPFSFYIAKIFADNHVRVIQCKLNLVARSTLTYLKRISVLLNLSNY